MTEIDAPKFVEFGIRLGKESVDKLLEVLRSNDWKQMLAYIDEDEAWRLFFAFSDLEVMNNIEFIASDEDVMHNVVTDFYKALAFSSKSLRFKVPKFEPMIERGDL